MIFIFCIVTVFMLSIGNLYISNVFFFPLLLKDYKKLSFDIIRLKVYFVFELLVLASTLLFVFQYKVGSIRTFVQFFFTTQYFLLALNQEALFDKWSKWFRLAGAFLAIYILLILLVTGHYKFLGLKFFSGENNYRMWGEGFIPQWPNGIPLSLVFVLWLELKSEDTKWYVCVLLFFASIVTTSRIGILGSVLVVLYFYYQKLRTQVLKIKLINSFILVGIIIIGIFTIVSHDFLVRRMLYFGDRSELLKISIDAILRRPLLGYGGNTLDVISKLFPFTTNYPFALQHTHNTFLEIAVRYGVPALVLFCLLLVLCYKEINKKHYKFMFLLLVGMSCFQIFIRDFTFIIYFLFVMNDGKKEIQGVDYGVNSGN